MDTKVTPKVEKIIMLNVKLAREIEQTFLVIVESLGKTKFRYTSRALSSFVFKIGYLNSAILELSVNKNLCSAAIIYRSIIEYSFRYLYIHARALNEDSDNIGEKYYKKLKAGEDLMALTKINNYNSIHNSGKKNGI